MEEILLTQYQNNKSEENIKKILEYCKQNYNNLNIKNDISRKLYRYAVWYLMNFKLGNMDNEEAKLLISFFVKECGYDFGIINKINVNILNKKEYQDEYGNSSSANCKYSDEDMYTCTYSENVINQVKSDNVNEFLRGLQNIFHELTHVMQGIAIRGGNVKGINLSGKKSIYIMALETIARKADPKMYDKNYSSLLKENNAEKVGLFLAMEWIKKYNKRVYSLYNKEKINDSLNSYDSNFYNTKLSILNVEDSSIKIIDTSASLYIEDNPNILNEFPILKLGYNLDGTKKNIIEVLNEREEILKDNSEIDEINDLFSIILNHKHFDSRRGTGTKQELILLDNYIKENNITDEYIYDLIRFRLKRANFSNEQIDKFIEQEKEEAQINSNNFKR